MSILCIRCGGSKLDPYALTYEHGQYVEQPCPLCTLDYITLGRITEDMAEEYQRNPCAQHALAVARAHEEDLMGVVQELANEAAAAVVVFEDSEIPF